MSMLPNGSLAPREAPHQPAAATALAPLRPNRASALLTALLALLWLLFLGVQLGGVVGPAHHPALVKWAAKVPALQRASATLKGSGSARGDLVARAVAEQPPPRSIGDPPPVELGPPAGRGPNGLIEASAGIRLGPAAPRLAAVLRYAQPPAQAPPFLA